MSAAQYTIASYNVLSSSLAPPDYFTACDPKDLDEAVRLKRVETKLKALMERNAIICLQEVSTKWAGAFHALFSAHGYHFVFAPYGPFFNGYMGTALAFPTSAFALQTCVLSRVADRLPRGGRRGRQWGWVRWVRAAWGRLRVLLGGAEAEDDWLEASRNRKNVLVFARLRSIASDEVLCVGCYHMPCAFRTPKVMVAHTALVAQEAQKLAKDDMLVLCGDFNFDPSSSQYQLITTGSLPPSHPHYVSYRGWKPKLQHPMASAYVQATGKEPELTNKSKVRDEPVFQATLDFLFCKGCKAVSALPTPAAEGLMGVLPNAVEPSDHVLVGAVVQKE